MVSCSCTKILVVGGAAALALVSILGPIYALVWTSCTSTRTCAFGAELYNKEAQCSSKAEQLLDGDTCMVQCLGAGMLPSQPLLECVDGTMEGLESLVCSPPVFYDNRPLSGGLVEGAVTDGEPRTACVRAQNLKCKARSGGSAILLQLGGLTEKVCRALYQECVSLNAEFEFMSHTVPEGSEVYEGFEARGVCTLGCFEELLPEQALLAIPWAERVIPEDNIFGVPVNAPAENFCTEGAMCLDLMGSCNPEDDGDYYRFPTCASGFTQWVKVDRSRRIRYDGSPAYSQAGKWILEKGADPTSDAYGLTMARQPSFVTWPSLAATQWRVRCQKQVDALTVQEDFRMVTMTLGECTCTDAQDCSGHGTAYGSKDNGPDCHCTCDRGFAGDHCEKPLCEVPYVVNALRPACDEGAWLLPGQLCTPKCLDGYKPSYESFTCGLDGKWPADKLFLCTEAVVQEVIEGEVFSTTRQAPCTDKDCSWRGTASGLRLPNGTCACTCFPEYSGVDCRGWVGSCNAPLRKTIDNSAISTCAEGFKVEGSQCTAQCDEGYRATPKVLECRGTVLVPATFQCIGGPDVRKVWCSTMQYIAFSASGVAVLGLCGLCVFFGRSKSRQVEVFYNGNQLVSVDQDDQGKFNVIKAENTEPNPKLPRAVVSAIAPTYAVTTQRPFALEDSSSFDQLARQSGAVSLFAAEQAMEKKHLRSLACAAATEGARFALEVGPLIPPEYVVQVKQAYDETAEDTDLHPGDRPMLAPQLLGDGTAVSSTAPPQLPGATGSEPGVEGVGEVTLYAAGWGGPPPRPPTPPPPPPSGRFQPGQQVSLTGLVGHQALNGVQGLLVEYDYDRGAWVVQLEGFEDELKQVPERHLQEIQLSIHEVTQTSKSPWLLERLALEEHADAARQEHDRQRRERRGAAANAAKAGQQADLEATASARAECELQLKQAFAQADAEGLRAAAQRGRELLEQIAHCSAAERGPLIRLCQSAESRLEQYDEREDRRATNRAYQDRIQSGQVANWKLTPKQFWAAAEEGDVCKVRGGLKALQPLSIRSTDGMRYTVLHVACRRLCADAIQGGEAADNRLAIVRELVEAKANPNAGDSWDRTPLEYAMAEGGPEAATDEAVAAMLAACKDVGMMTRAEAAASIRSAAASTAASPSSRTGGASPAAGDRSP